MLERRLIKGDSINVFCLLEIWYKVRGHW
jgi:hypothetical protein